MPNQEPTNADILEAVNSFATHVDERFTAVDQRFASIDRQFADVRSDMRAGLADIRSEMVTKTQFKEDVSQLKSDLMTEIDRFVVLHQTLDVELVALRSRCERMEAFMLKVAKQLNLEYQVT